MHRVSLVSDRFGAAVFKIYETPVEFECDIVVGNGGDGVETGFVVFGVVLSKITRYLSSGRYFIKIESFENEEGINSYDLSITR